MGDIDNVVQLSQRREQLASMQAAIPISREKLAAQLEGSACGAAARR
jgi:hypothetical protein